MTGAEKPRSDEALALKAHFAEDGAQQPSTLELARFAAAMQELKDARDAFDLLIVGDTDGQQ